MIEVLFAESEAGAMKVAKNTIIAEHTDGPVSVWAAGKKKPPQKENCGWIPGTAREVVCLGFMWDIGDIREPADSRYRRNLIYKMYAQEQWEKDARMDAELQKLADCYVNEMTRLQKFLEDGEAVRIWYSHAPYSLCGLYFLCSILQQYENEVHTVELPPYVMQNNVIYSYPNWSDVAAEEFAGFLSYEKHLSKEELGYYACIWSTLQEDNSPLRAVVNGRVVGVPEDFYDFLIWKRITKEPIKEARLIGDILLHYPVSVGDWWYAARINHYIELGKIKVVENSENKYARVICLA